MGPEVMPLLENRDDINVGLADLIALANDSCILVFSLFLWDQDCALR